MFCSKKFEDILKYEGLLSSTLLNLFYPNQELYKDLYDKLLYHEAYWNAYNDDWNQKLCNENQRLKKKISELEKSNK